MYNLPIASMIKSTFEEYRFMEKKLNDDRLKEKLKTMGSLYGVPST